MFYRIGNKQLIGKINLQAQCWSIPPIKIKFGKKFDLSLKKECWERRVNLIRKGFEASWDLVHIDADKTCWPASF